jgi:hypothetical protein
MQSRRTIAEIELQDFKNDLTARQGELERLLRKRKPVEADTSADVFDQIHPMAERNLALGTLELEWIFVREVDPPHRRVDVVVSRHVSIEKKTSA